MTNKGIDANTDLTNHATCLKGAGIDWVGRYYKHGSSCLTRSEASVLSHAGLYIVTVVEAGFPTSAGYFSHAKGLSDGAWAYRYAHEVIGQPGGSAIYFAVDFDASLEDLAGPIKSYFQGIHEAFGPNPLYAVGVYGSGATCASITKNTPTQYSWLTMSKGWRGGRTFKGWNINQLAGATICGVSVDTDETNGHGGGWKL